MDPAILANLVTYSIAIVLLIAGLVLVILPFYREPEEGYSKWMWSIGGLLSAAGLGIAVVLLIRPAQTPEAYLPIPTYAPVVNLPTPVGTYPVSLGTPLSPTRATRTPAPGVMTPAVITATELAGSAPLSPQVTSLVQVWSIDEDGVRVNVNALGVYNFAYKGDAYSLWPNAQYTDYRGWTTLVKIYFNRPVEWGQTEFGLIGPIHEQEDLGSGDYFLEQPAAVAATDGAGRAFRLNAGDYVTLVVFDQKGKFGDNRGKVDIGITYGGP